MRTAIIAAGTATVIAAGLSAGGTPAHAYNKEALGKRYLHAVCSVNRASADITDAWSGAKNRVTIGTPVPYAARQAYRKGSKISAQASRIIRKGNWPDELDNEADRMALYYFKLSTFYLSRDTPTVSRSWKPDSYLPSNGWATDEIRYELNLPPRGRGCGRA